MATVRQAPAAVALQASGLTKRFGARTALRDVDLSVAAGELIAVMGPNGAGKTMLLSILAGVLRPDSGSVETPGGTAGWVPQQLAVYTRLTVAENLRLFARLEGRGDVEAGIEAMLEQSGLSGRADDEVGSLSGGNRQRVNIAAGLIANPAILLLDEPSTALDPIQRERLADFIARLNDAGRTIIYSTHNLDEAQRYADRVVLLDEGEVVYDGPPAQLAARAGARDGDFEAGFVTLVREHHAHEDGGAED